ncbi:cytochrome PufQ [Pseudoponticoccus marisrubri]|uniref:Protein pufQ n=1 Tax=Pseudoponticoccus marisrubri TaxID=1685382 RepID=A0A0W7WHR2_9RHOB|nr:cytochrome PufQ [Pseudoponticoccus marisrubri]KUF10008.1 protein pufQ [Pseudoponticoccus marisrubri]
MADFTSDVPHRAPRRRGAEFHTYFVLIFLAALPFSTVRWVVDIAQRRTLNMRGPLARAWAEADRITPLLFTA